MGLFFKQSSRKDGWNSVSPATDIENTLSKYRSAYMGFAILWIMLFHFKAFSNVPVIGFFNKFGSLGVDIFFFLSALGLCYSMSKVRSLKEYFFRRAVRILPTWLFFLVCFHILNSLWADGGSHPTNLIESLGYYTGIGWWVRGLIHINSHNYWYEWYVPTLLLFYAVFPLLYRLSVKKLSVLTILFLFAGLVFISFNSLCAHFQMDNPLSDLCSALQWSYQRIPVFLCGILTFKFFSSSKDKSAELAAGSCKRLNVMMFLSAFALLLLFLSPKIIPWQFLRVTFTRYIFILALPMTFWILTGLFRLRILKLIFSFLGTISLELYMVHVERWPLDAVSQYIDSSVLAIGVTFVLCVLIAAGIHFLFKPINSWLLKRALPD